jgi:1-deoxy-D-xylulose-5-phosphate reductoisomerase
VLNAANEVAVDAFLGGRLPFVGIAELIERLLADLAPGGLESIEACVAVDAEARRRARQVVDALSGGSSS